jgi:hypothetical protein
MGNLKKISLKSGISLIEILVYVSVLMTLLALVTNFLYQVANFKVNNQIQTAVFQNSNIAINKITQDLKQATEVNVPADSSFTDILSLQTNEGLVEYTVGHGFLLRNGQEITDNLVFINLGVGNRGFRRLGNSVQIIMGVVSVQKPFGQQQKETIYQTSVSLKQ